MRINSLAYLQIRAFYFIILIFLVLFYMLTGCASSYQMDLDSSETHKINIEQILREELKLWIYTPYSMGGTKFGGTDCSGFVMIVYDKLFRITLPRDTINQATAGVFINKKELKPGDLVFFKPPKIRRHVGIYLNSGEFAHTSSRKGVTISRIDDPYWNKYYWTSRRILP
ncbi:MAG: NlpC/P60 family protein [Pseudomonadota bacterium]